jgi:hypothetical protein
MPSFHFEKAPPYVRDDRLHGGAQSAEAAPIGIEERRSAWRPAGAGRTVASKNHCDNKRRRRRADSGARRQGHLALGSFASSALPSGCHPSDAACQQRECAVAPVERSDLDRSRICQRSADGCELSSVRAALSGHRHFAGHCRAGRESTARHVPAGWRTNLSRAVAQVSCDAGVVASQSGLRLDREKVGIGGVHGQGPRVHRRHSARYRTICAGGDPAQGVRRSARVASRLRIQHDGGRAGAVRPGSLRNGTKAHCGLEAAFRFRCHCL